MMNPARRFQLSAAAPLAAREASTGSGARAAPILPQRLAPRQLQLPLAFAPVEPGRKLRTD